MNVRCFATVLALTLLGANAPITPLGAPDPRIVALVAAVSPTRVAGDDAQLVGFWTRNDFSETTSTKRRGVVAARDWIAAQFRKIAAKTDGRMSVRFDTYIQAKTARTPRAVKESSVIATLRGSEPGRVYVMSSHYDDCNGDCTNGTRAAPGADDNASGTSAVLEAARVMAQTHFRGTIIFACFDGEELGLWGSDHFTRELAAQHIHVLADLNNDIVGETAGGGGSEPHVIRVFSQALPHGAKLGLVNLLGSESDSPSRELSRFAAGIVPEYVAGFRVRQIFRADRLLRGGDQESFEEQGFPAIRFTESHENFTHQHQNVRIQNGIQYGDIERYIDPTYLADATRANVAALASLALGPAAPHRVRMVLAHLGYTTTLRWKRAADAVGYEILWRATTAPNRQHLRAVGDVTQAAVPASYDDFIFGVRSVDARGLRSPAVYPFPTRH